MIYLTFSQFVTISHWRQVATLGLDEIILTARTGRLGRPDPASASGSRVGSGSGRGRCQPAYGPRRESRRRRPGAALSIALSASARPFGGRETRAGIGGDAGEQRLVAGDVVEVRRNSGSANPSRMAMASRKAETASAGRPHFWSTIPWRLSADRQGATGKFAGNVRPRPSCAGSPAPCPTTAAPRKACPSPEQKSATAP